MNAPFHPLTEDLPRRRFSVDDFFRMVEVGLIDGDERLEMLDGEIVPMSPKGSRHESLKAAIADFWVRRPQHVVVAFEPGLRLSALTYLEPDLIVYSRANRLAELKGPDILLAVEVSDSSLGYDLHRKPAIYAAYGVKELWVFDAVRRKVHVHRGPGPEGFSDVRAHAAAERVTPQFAPVELAFALDELPIV